MTNTAEIRFGLTLGNRDLVHDTLSAAELLEMAELAEGCPAVDSVWVGDSLLAQPRLESLTLLSALAARTRRVLLGTACMGSFALRNPLLLADQWASLDHLAGGRTVLVACTGGRTGAVDAEARTMGIATGRRRSRMLENIEVIRALWAHDDVTFSGEHTSLDGVTVMPKPLQARCPIWIASNPAGPSRESVDRSLTTIAGVIDGWMTHSTTPAEFQRRWDLLTNAAREQGSSEPLDNCLYHNININPDREVALVEAKAYLDRYYGADFSREKVEAWCALGTVEQCIADLRAYAGSGVRRITLRICSDDQHGQLLTLLRDVLPAVEAAL